MSHTWVRLSAVTLVGFVCVAIAFAQTPPSAPAPNSPSTTAEPRTVASTVAERREVVDEQQWDAAKAKWSKENTKWAECDQQATDQKLTGRDSWVFHLQMHVLNKTHQNPPDNSHEPARLTVTADWAANCGDEKRPSILRSSRLSIPPQSPIR